MGISQKGMATRSRILAWRIPWAEEPGGLQSMGWQRVGRDGAKKSTAHLKKNVIYEEKERRDTPLICKSRPYKI